MRRLLLISLLFAACAQDNVDTATNPILGTWQSSNTTLALTPFPVEPTYVHIAPNGGVVTSSYTVSGDRINLQYLAPESRFELAGNTLTIFYAPEWGLKQTTTYARIGSYCSDCVQ